nr:hypothetical protein B0A51_08947 [Rachicladosporium sp. CCFEE 5018]
MLTLLTTLLAVASAAPNGPSGSWHGWHGGNGGYGGGGNKGGAPSASIKNGTVTGLHSSTYNQDYFLGVPYAQPPTGENRFRIPQSINASYGTYAATEYAPSCVGYGGDELTYPLSEDCLYLNVVRPSGYEHQKLPIGFWIHGGGLVMGGSRDLRYNLSFIVENSIKIGKPIIGVSINYRKQGWGFLASEQVSGAGATNIGFRDQRLALHWVQENIAAFGGDASKVTIWGESAGALSVGTHLVAYNGRDDKLFSGAIMESGNPVNYNAFKSVIDYQPIYDGLVNATGCNNAIDTLNCIRLASFDSINNFFNSTAGSGWNPIVDGDFIARWGSEQLAEGAFVKVPIIDGANSDEGGSFGPRGLNTTAKFIAAATNVSSRGTVIPPQFSDQLLAAYPVEPEYFIPSVQESGPASSDADAQQRRTNAYYGDLVFIANRRGAVEAWTEYDVPAYSYRFNTLPNGLTIVAHFQEVAFVFDNLQGLGYGYPWGSLPPFAGKPQTYTDLAFLMSSSWASFIHDGNPNFSQGKPSGLAKTPDWPVYSLSNPENIVFDVNVTGVANVEPDTFRKEGIQFILDHNLLSSRLHVLAAKETTARTSPKVF